MDCNDRLRKQSLRFGGPLAIERQEDIWIRRTIEIRRCNTTASGSSTPQTAHRHSQRMHQQSPFVCEHPGGEYRVGSCAFKSIDLLQSVIEQWSIRSNDRVGKGSFMRAEQRNNAIVFILHPRIHLLACLPYSMHMRLTVEGLSIGKLELTTTAQSHSQSRMSWQELERRIVLPACIGWLGFGSRRVRRFHLHRCLRRRGLLSGSLASVTKEPRQHTNYHCHQRNTHYRGSNGDNFRV
jgi:hypothetical protein